MKAFSYTSLLIFFPLLFFFDLIPSMSEAVATTGLDCESFPIFVSYDLALPVTVPEHSL